MLVSKTSTPPPLIPLPLPPRRLNSPSLKKNKLKNGRTNFAHLNTMGFVSFRV